METIKNILGTTKLFTQNSKIKKTSKKFGIKLVNFGIPAYKSITGKVVCPFADACVKYCYACSGAYVWSNVKAAFEKRYQATKSDFFVFFAIAELQKSKANFVRIHDSGDFYSKAYRDKWFAIAQALPNVNFYAYTKSHDMFRGVTLPDNMDIIYSEGSKLDHKLNRETERHAKIFDSVEELQAAGYVDASEYDLFATKWFADSHKIGLVFH